jgi:hypothetical protein
MIIVYGVLVAIYAVACALTFGAFSGQLIMSIVGVAACALGLGFSI